MTSLDDRLSAAAREHSHRHVPVPLEALRARAGRRGAVRVAASGLALAGVLAGGLTLDGPWLSQPDQLTAAAPGDIDRARPAPGRRLPASVLGVTDPDSTDADPVEPTLPVVAASEDGAVQAVWFQTRDGAGPCMYLVDARGAMGGVCDASLDPRSLSVSGLGPSTTNGVRGQDVWLFGTAPAGTTTVRATERAGSTTVGRAFDGGTVSDGAFYVLRVTDEVPRFDVEALDASGGRLARVERKDG